MSLKALAVLFSGLALIQPVLADTLELKPDHPDRYVVVKGDTLWDISSRFLKDPWRWPNIWNKNEQIKNPHLIYPGDVILLRYVNGQPELTIARQGEPQPAPSGAINEPPSVAAEQRVERPDLPGTDRLHPQVRDESLESAIPTIRPDAIGPFLTQPLVVTANELKRAGYVTVGLDNRNALGTLSQFYARGLGKEPKERYNIFRQGKVLKHPDSGEVLGYEAMFLGEARLLQGGDPAKLEITSVKQEILPTDRLLEAPEAAPLPYYYPRPPEKKVYGRILSAINGVAEFGPGQVVSISLGQRDGIEDGHVLRIMRHVGKARDPVTGGRYRIPDEETGLMMVFRTFNKVSFGLIMNATQPVHLYDAVQTP